MYQLVPLHEARCYDSITPLSAADGFTICAVCSVMTCYLLLALGFCWLVLSFDAAVKVIARTRSTTAYMTRYYLVIFLCPLPSVFVLISGKMMGYARGQMTCMIHSGNIYANLMKVVGYPLLLLCLLGFFVLLWLVLTIYKQLITRTVSTKDAIGIYYGPVLFLVLGILVFALQAINVTFAASKWNIILDALQTWRQCKFSSYWSSSSVASHDCYNFTRSYYGQQIGSSVAVAGQGFIVFLLFAPRTVYYWKNHLGYRKVLPSELPVTSTAAGPHGELSAPPVSVVTVHRSIDSMYFVDGAAAAANANAAAAGAAADTAMLSGPRSAPKMQNYVAL